ncbi:MAG: hypothetical protein JO235_28550, partial [Chroococcidiopsidaceae cyanobacterium CP_BM_RX_35]|nr:hypothetical protein [Chroococcidiopsidaceae cyanobacterium CP_BM_RX_35]
MTPEEIGSALTASFDSAAIQTLAPGSWQVETQDFRLLVLLSDDQSWLRVLLPIVSAEAAQPVYEQLLAANFDDTQEVRYALHQGVVWGVFQHSREGLGQSDFSAVIARLIFLHRQGLSGLFNQLIESRIHQVIYAAKQQGQSLEATLQTLDRLYEEGVMGEMESGAESREQVLAAWRYQLQRLWSE